MFEYLKQVGASCGSNLMMYPFASMQLAFIHVHVYMLYQIIESMKSIGQNKHLPINQIDHVTHTHTHTHTGPSINIYMYREHVPFHQFVF